MCIYLILFSILIYANWSSFTRGRNDSRRRRRKRRRTDLKVKYVLPATTNDWYLNIGKHCSTSTKPSSYRTGWWLFANNPAIMPLIIIQRLIRFSAQKLTSIIGNGNGDGDIGYSWSSITVIDKKPLDDPETEFI